MKGPSVRLAALVGLGVAGAIALTRRGSRVATGHAVDGGVLMGDPAGYDRLSRLLFDPLFRGIAADVAKAVPPPATILEVGCGPGQLSIRLAGSHGFTVTGLDLDPAMIERARARAHGSSADGSGTQPTFVVGDVASLPFADASFDVAISTFSMHHWADRTAGLTEIARVVRPGGRVLIWDLKQGRIPLHAHVHRPAAAIADLPLRHVSVEDWHWPGPLTLAQRIEAVRD